MARPRPKAIDRHKLYQEAVQCTQADLDLIKRVYRQHNGRAPLRLREDFCGTALLACDWVRSAREREAVGVDLDQPTLDWGVEHNVSQLPPHAQARVHLVKADVRHVTTEPVDVVAALNFSYFVFKQRRDLVAYFANARQALREGGLLVLDAYGGFEAQEVMHERTRYRRFTYIWQQAAFDAINDYTRCHIHFELPDGRRVKRAFTYDWRLWSLASIRDALADAGYQSSEVYWEGTNRHGRGNGVFRRQSAAENCAAWVAYIVANA